MKRKDFDLLRKTMAMTTSPNDGEALNAIRVANRLIERGGSSWDRFFDRVLGVGAAFDPGAAAQAGYRQEPQAPKPAWRPGDGMEDASAHARAPAGFGRDEEPGGPPLHDEPPDSAYDDFMESDIEVKKQPVGRLVDEEAERRVLDITECFEVLDRVGVEEHTQDFVNSLRAQFRRRADLSDKQLGALRKFKATALRRENGRG